MGRFSVSASAPGRVNLIGEHTDYNHGLCLPLALALRTRVTARRRTDGQLSITSGEFQDPWVAPLAEVVPGRVAGWQSYAAGVVWALGDLAGGAARVWPDGLDLTITSDVPQGAGLSSSAAVECAVAVATSRLAVVSGGTRGQSWSRDQLVTACIRAESEMAGAPTGGMDQTIAMFAPESGALLLDFADPTQVAHTPVSLALDEADLSLLIVDTRVSHALGDGGYADRRDACERASAALGVASLRETTLDAVETLTDEVLRRRARHVVSENQRVLDAIDALQNHDWNGLGALFIASHRSMRDDFEISTPELDAVVDLAPSVGALGARMTGGGFGGSAIALLPRLREPQFTEEVQAAFERAGWSPPTIRRATPGQAATVDDEG